jgi:SAM-dependent methyltransferase
MNCKVCGGEAQSFLRVSTDELNEPFLDGTLRGHLPELKLCRCRKCGCLWADDARQDNEILNSAYHRVSDAYFDSEAIGRRYIEFYRSLENLLKSSVRGRKILDVGCGDGTFLSTLSQDWTKRGLEPSVSGAALSRAKELDVVCGTLDESIGAERVDVISALDVIEHVPDPHNFIESLKKHLQPGGTILLLTGDSDSYPARVAGARWSYLRWCGHISIFSGSGLRKLLQSHGLELIAWQRCEHPSSPGPLAWWRVHLLEPLRKLLGRSPSWYPFWRDHQAMVVRLKDNSAV